ncbi:hypothetical protein SDC9_40031 [bioreactor metagenome]|uniref:Peptidase C45 hydrolase domain-containing protein n=1 Tax=bioreactor metagenome TaxID=1076179 RepID=A0A644VU29_9ZZZZ
MKRLLAWGILVLFLIGSAGVTPSSAGEVLVLEGSAAEVGKLWGETNKESIIKAFNAFLSRAEGKEDQLRSFAKLSIDLSKKIGCSYWIDELNAIADTAGIDRELYIAFTFGRYRDLALLYKGVGCTTFAVTPPATKNGRIIFHKTRETAPDLQSGYLKRITGVQGTDRQPYKFFGEMGTADTGISFFVNEKGLAGGADVPSQWQNRECYVGSYKGTLPFVTPPKYDGFMNHYVPRYIAEHCRNVDEAKEALHSFAEKGYLASGKWGTNYLFVDARGKILQIADDCYKIIEEQMDPALEKDGKSWKGIYFTVHRENDYGTPEDALVSAYGKITAELVNSPGVAKHPAMWNFPRAQSSATIVIDPEFPEKMTTVFVTLPAYSYSIPFFMGANATPKALADGTVYSVQKDSYRYSEFYEAGINDLWRAFAYDIRERVKKGEDVTKDLNGFFGQMVDQVLTMNK